ncbi:MAG: SRPBCC family protein [Tardiphaga sp.]
MMEGPNIVASNFKPGIVYTIYIASTPENIWQALTSADFSRQYFSGFAVEMEQKLGGAFAVNMPDGSPHISGEVIEYDPPRKLTITWDVNWPGLVEALGHTLVTYELEKVGDAVGLTMIQAHDRAIDDDILAGGRLGWPAILSSLKSLLETGRAPAIALAPPEKMLAALQRLGVKVPGM